MLIRYRSTMTRLASMTSKPFEVIIKNFHKLCADLYTYGLAAVSKRY